MWGGNDQSELLLFKGNDARPDYGPDRIRLLASEVRFDTGVETEGTFEGIGTFGSTKMIIATSGNVGIGTTVPTNTLHVNGNTIIGTNINYINKYIPTSNGLVNNVSITSLNKRVRTSNINAISAVSTWTSRASAADNTWTSVCWSPELSIFVAVSDTGAGNRVMTSPDGITWTSRTSASDNGWSSVCWSPELSIFVAVSGTGSGNRVMTSSDGITWTSRTSAVDNGWSSVCWSPELYIFVAVAASGTVTGNRVMTSPDGITWTARTSPSDNSWYSICWSPELSIFVAVAGSGTGNRVMTSSDGITWTSRTAATNSFWISVCWSPELSIFVAVSWSSNVMTSLDGISWISRTAATNSFWNSVCWSPELSIFVAIANNTPVFTVMTSFDSITWTSRTSAINAWTSICWSPELSMFVAVANSGSGNRAMTSKIALPNSKSTILCAPSQVTVNANGLVGINTTSPTEMLDVRGNFRVGGSTQSNYIVFNGVTGDGTVTANRAYIGERLWGGNDRSELLIFKGDDIDPGFGPDRIRLLAPEIRFDTGIGVGGPFESVATYGSTKMTIATSGNVGIGTTNPSYTLDISSNSVTDAVRIRNSNASGYASIAYNNNNAFWFGGVGGSNAPSYAGSYYIASDNATFVGRQNGNWGINEQLPNSTLHIKSRFSTSGNLLVVNGTTPNNVYLNTLRNGSFYSTEPDARGGLAIDKDHQNPGDIHLILRTCAAASTNFNFITAQTNLSVAQGFQNSGLNGSVDQFIVRGNGNVVNTGNSYGGTSDIKLKENIEDARNYLEDLSKLRVVKYSFKNENLENPNQLGLIAQEVEQVFPGLIEESEDKDSEGNSLGTTTKAVKYSIINIMMLKAVQELRESNNKLNTLLQDQEKEIKMLKDFIMTKFPGELN